MTTKTKTGKKAPAALSPEFEHASGWRELCDPILKAATRQDALRGHLAARQQIDRNRSDIQGFLDAMLAANGMKVAGWWAKLGHTPVADKRTAQVAALPLEQMRYELACEVRWAAEQVMQDLLGALEKMVESRHIGRFEWESADVCFFHWFSLREEQHLVREWVSNGQRHRKFEKKQVLTRTRHELIDAVAHPLPADSVARPARVATLLGSVPACLGGLVRVVDGTLIREQVAEQVVGVEQWTESAPVPVQHRDPAVVIGDYVLTGWAPAEAWWERFWIITVVASAGLMLLAAAVAIACR